MTKIEINGPEIERADGTVRRIGYGIDGEGRVNCRFALPQGHEWDAPDATESVECVHSIDELPPKDDYYRNTS